MSFNIENVPAKLVPFDLTSGADLVASSMGSSIQGVANDGSQVAPLTIQNSGDLFTDAWQQTAGSTAAAAAPLPSAGQVTGTNTLTKVGEGTRTFQNRVSSAVTGPVPRSAIVGGDPLSPIIASGGLIFEYTPTINESIGVKYDSTELVHANEGIYTYRGTENRRISLSNCVWTADTPSKARYMLAVIHFFRSYSLMDFGRAVNGRKGGTGKPPSPMWFSALGAYMYQDVPVFLESADFTISTEQCDLVGVPNPDTNAGSSDALRTAYGNIGKVQAEASDYTWLPLHLEVSIKLVVQHSVRYWTHEFSLEDFKSGKMISRSGDFGFQRDGSIIGPGGLLGGGV